MASLSSGPQGGKGIYSPTYVVNRYAKEWVATDFDDTTPVEFLRVMGPHRIIMTLTTTGEGGGIYTFSFSLTGGTNQPVTNSRVMFPNTAKVYNQTINFIVNGSEVPPTGCVVTTDPIPESKIPTRINIFRVRETLSGDDTTFIFRMCPFLNIPTTIETTEDLPADSTLAVYAEFYRVHPNLRTEGILISREAPSYRAQLYTTTITPVDNVSPLDDPTTKVPFKRFSGQQTIVMTNNTTNYYFSFDLDYGIIGQGNGYLGWCSGTANGRVVKSEPIGCTIENVVISGANTNALAKVIRLRVTTEVGDGGGRVYLLEVSPSGYNQIPPTISRELGAAIGDEIVTVQVCGRYFQTV